MERAIDATPDFKVDPTIVNDGGEVIFGDEFIGDVVKFDANILEWTSGVQR